MEGLIFGAVDNAVLVFGAFTGLEIEKILPKRLQTGLGAVIGAGLGNTISDTCGALLDPSMDSRMALGIAIGCVTSLVLIPLFARFRAV